MKKILAVMLGSPYSGSTLLSHLLNVHPDALAIGESSRLRRFRQYPMNPEHYLDQCSICATHAHYDCPVWRCDGSENEPASAAAFLSSLVAYGPYQVIIDSSKEVDWLIYLLTQAIDVEVRAIVISRSPFSFTVSNRVAVPEHDVVWHACGWRDIYLHALRTLAGHSLPYMIVRYETLIKHPARLVQSIWSFLGLENGELDLRAVSQTEIHPLGGNLREIFRMKGFDRERFLSLDIPEARTMRRLATDAPEYLEDRTILPERASTWESLSRTDLAAIIQTPGVMEVFNYLGYSLSSFMRD